jgi:hypothetical protein
MARSSRSTANEGPSNTPGSYLTAIGALAIAETGEPDA